MADGGSALVAGPGYDRTGALLADLLNFEPVTHNIVLMCLLAISAYYTMCMQCMQIVLLAEIASKKINTILWVTGSVNLPVMLQCSCVPEKWYLSQI